jgi:tripartite-type tricarboxylate transporter receptor subunit TctC
MWDRILLAGLAIAAIVATPAARAQDKAYPAKPVELVVPFPAGGAADVIARLVAQVVSEKWGQSVVIENKAGVTRPPPSHFQGGASWPRGGEDRQ